MTTIKKVFFIILAFSVLSGCLNTSPPDNRTMPISTSAQNPSLNDTLSPTVKPTEIIKITPNESDIITDSEYEVYSSDIIPNSEYEVYSSVLLSKYPHQANEIVVHQLTSNMTICSNYDCFQNFKNYSFKDYFMLVDDYKNKNANVYKLENKFLLPHTVILISNNEFNEIFQNMTGWDAFYKIYPNSPGIISISRVGFNGDQTQAILYFDYQRGFVWGEGYLIFLTKDQGKWVVKEEHQLWVS